MIDNEPRLLEMTVRTNYVIFSRAEHMIMGIVLVTTRPRDDCSIAALTAKRGIGENAVKLNRGIVN